MVNKNTDFKFNKKNQSKVIFYIILILYISGLVSGCLFALKNSENLDFVKIITLTENLSQRPNNTVFGAYIRCFIRDILCICFLLIYKYSGVLKSLCITVPFILGLQNSCIYLSNYINGEGAGEIVFRYILKDTAISFFVIMYCMVIVSDIINSRSNIKKDYYKLAVYLIGVFIVYVIDFIIKLFFL